MLLLLDAVFVVVAVVLSMRQSVAWQKQFLGACVAQVLLQVAVFEVAECVLTQFCIPRLVAPDVAQALRRLVQTAEQALSLSAYYATSARHGYENASKGHFPVLNAPSFFFPSRRLADQFDSLFESFLVASFCSQDPPRQLAPPAALAYSSGVSVPRVYNIVTAVEHSLLSLGGSTQELPLLSSSLLLLLAPSVLS
jgi:hypothetical protein